MPANTRPIHLNLAFDLGLLTILFALRILGQWLQWVAPTDWLPPFQQWHSEALPYPLLLAAQLLILVAMLLYANAVRTGRMSLNPRYGKYLMIVAGCYFWLMALRLVLGLTLLSEYRWFASTIPAFFHLVLAAYLWFIAQYHLHQQATVTSPLKSIGNLLPWLIHPATLGSAIGLHLFLQQQQQSLLMSTYIPVLLAASVITLLEYRRPYSRDWHPDKKELQTDLSFMLTVQVLLPKLLSVGIVILFIPVLQENTPVVTSFWPHQWPIIGQLVLMLVVVEFFRYWLHRAAHNIPWLWRVHAVHHSPKKLYWLNVGRFHPLEKILQMLFDTVPFILLGVNEKLLSLYFVFYAINGFFQHSNIKLRLGLLNYVISGPELHRWHHSINTSEASHNYGNNLILWDLVFGSYFLPKDRTIKQLGINVPNYPDSFWGQLRAPLREIHRQSTSLRSKVYFALMKILFIFTDIRLWRPLISYSRHPAKAQNRCLKSILHHNRDTHFAREHHLESIHSIEDFQQRVAIHQYEDLRPYIEQQIKTGIKVLTGERALFYATTSGTTGHAKYLPVTQTTLKQHRQQQVIFSQQLYRLYPSAFTGKLLAINSPAIEGYFDNGTAFGSISGFIAANTPAIIRHRYILPNEISTIEDYDKKYLLIAYLALRENDISLIVTPNPSTLLRIIDVINDHFKQLVLDLRTGHYHDINNLPMHVRKLLDSTYLSLPKRANQIEMAMANQGRLTIAKLWPDLKLVSTWTGGSCGQAISTLKHQLPDRGRIFELGYISSEFRGTIPLANRATAGIPIINHHFYEFIQVEQWDRGIRDTLLLDQLQDGHEYYIIVTTRSGLYRYFINDIVRVNGFINKTPLLEFIQKGKGVTNICGEKLYEGQVNMALRELEMKYSFHTRFCLMLASEQDSVYRLYLDGNNVPAPTLTDISADLDALLGQFNMEYRSRRASGRLHQPQIILLQQGVGELYKRHKMKQGIREGQYKHIAIQYESENDFAFTCWTIQETNKSE